MPKLHIPYICFLLTIVLNKLARLLEYGIRIYLVYTLYILSIYIPYTPNKVSCAIVLYTKHILSIYLYYYLLISRLTTNVPYRPVGYAG